jgi:hypothetical protein
MSAPNPFSIAIGGLRPGASTLEIGSQGMLTITITPPEPENEDVGLFIPMVWSSPRTRQDCRIEVQGCRATISATGDNLAAAIPSTEEQDIYDDIAFCEEYNRRLDEREAAEAEKRAHERFTERLRQANEIRAERTKQRQFREDVFELAKDIKTYNDPAEDLAALVVILKYEVNELSDRIREIEAEKTTATPKPKTRRKK